MYTISKDESWCHSLVKMNPEGKAFFDKLDAFSSKGEIVIFGAGSWGKSLISVSSKYSWKCVIDNNPKAKEISGIPILSVNEFLKNYNNEYIFISSRVYCKEMYHQLIRNGIEKSHICNFGETLDNMAKRQYFDLEFLPKADHEVFVDIGAYDGMTSVNFNEWCAESESYIYIFEPDKTNRIRCEENLKLNNANYRIVPKGAWSEETILNFNARSNGASCIAEEGNEVINVTTMDNVLEGEKVSFIKMDIEGSELEALLGAEKTIKRNTPKLAISIYHKPDDIWKIPEIILDYCSDYKLYLRHYSLTDGETVMYAII